MSASLVTFEVLTASSENLTVNLRYIEFTPVAPSEPITLPMSDALAPLTPGQYVTAETDNYGTVTRVLASRTI